MTRPLVVTLGGLGAAYSLVSSVPYLNTVEYRASWYWASWNRASWFRASWNRASLFRAGWKRCELTVIRGKVPHTKTDTAFARVGRSNCSNYTLLIGPFRSRGQRSKFRVKVQRLQNENENGFKTKIVFAFDFENEVKN